MIRQHDFFSSHHQHFQWKMNFYHDGRGFISPSTIRSIYTIPSRCCPPRKHYHWELHRPKLVRPLSFHKVVVTRHWIWQLLVVPDLSSAFAFFKAGRLRCRRYPTIANDSLNGSKPWKSSFDLSYHCCSKTMLNQEWNIGWFIMKCWQRLTCVTAFQHVWQHLESPRSKIVKKWKRTVNNMT